MYLGRRLKIKYVYFILIIIFLVFILFQTIPFTDNIKFKKNEENIKKEKLKNINYIYKKNTYGNFNKTLNKISKNKKWSLIIPGILNESEIKESVEDNILNEYIGHFETSKILDGNVALAAHNRGYFKNYFSKLKNINLNDEIIYIVGISKFKYKVSEKYIINEYDITPLYEKGQREITLITCIENIPEKRLVVKGKYVGLKD